MRRISKVLVRTTMTFLFLSVGLLVSSDLFAVTFKLSNDSQYTIRARAYDRGEWRSWVTFSPGEWGDFAKKVTRSVHTVQLQVRINGRWEELYWGNHGSKMFTRIVQVVEDSYGNFRLAWWDEPPGCRDRPPSPYYGGSTCLKESGWIWRKFWDYTKKVGIAAGKAILMNGG